MRVIYNLNSIPDYIAKRKKSIIALGVFDGLHRAHARIIKKVVHYAGKIKGVSIVLTFYPHPQDAPSIYSLPHRLKLLEELGVEMCVVIKFNKEFSGMPAEKFVSGLLVKKLKVFRLYVGENFHFGPGASADVAKLRELSRRNSFSLEVCKEIKAGNQAISSSGIRRLILAGKLNSAARLLGRRVSILGEVIRGIGFGKKLSFPTANIDPHHDIVPADGIYAVRVNINKKIHDGVCFIGRRSVFPVNKNVKNAKMDSRNIEAHVFNFNKNIYSQYIEIQFIKKIRDPRKFSSPAELILQINSDIRKAKQILSPV